LPGEFAAAAKLIEGQARLNHQLEQLIPLIAELVGVPDKREAGEPTMKKLWREARQSNVGDTQIKLPAYGLNPAILEGLLIIVPFGTVLATVQIGDWNIPVPLQNTSVLWAPLKWRVHPSELQVLNYSPAGTAFFGAWGEQVPAVGSY